jgi:hypothetical protein
MGFGPPGSKQYHEVCVELKGPVDPKEFEKYKKKMKKCLAELRRLGLDIKTSKPRIWVYNPSRRPAAAKKTRKR